MDIDIKHKPKDVCKICPNKFKHLTDECEYKLQEININIENGKNTIAKTRCISYFETYRTELRNIFDIDRHILLSSEITHSVPDPGGFVYHKEVGYI